MHDNLRNLVDSNPAIGALLEHMVQSESSTKTDTTEYLNKFEVVKDVLRKLNIDIENVQHDSFEKLCPLLMNAILIQSSKLDKAAVEDWHSEETYIDLTTSDPIENRKIEDCFAKYDYLKDLDPTELKSRFMYISSFNMGRLERLVLAKSLVDVALEKQFTPLPLWVKYLDSNGL